MLGAWGYLERLCRFPHRGTGTKEEAAAAGEIQAWLTALGYHVNRQSFRTPRDTLYLGPPIIMMGFVIAAWVGHRHPWLALVLCILLLIPMVGEMLCSSVDFDLLLPLYHSQNVIAKAPRASGARRTIVISGHYDTQRASYLFHPRFAPFIQPYFYLAYATLMVVPVGIICALVFPSNPWTTWLLAIAAPLLVINAAFLLLCRFTGRYINGANDNGTGAALVLALAERFAQVPLADTELIFVLTGAEEVGTRGMKHYVRTAGLDPAQTQFINLDNLGGGTIHYLLGEGMLSYKRYDEELVALAKGMAPRYVVHSKRNLLLPTDGIVPAVAGYRAITFLAFLADGSLPNYHWYTDTLERVDRTLLDTCEQFFTEYVATLAQTPESGSPT